MILGADLDAARIPLKTLPSEGDRCSQQMLDAAGNHCTSAGIQQHSQLSQTFLHLPICNLHRTLLHDARASAHARSLAIACNFNIDSCIHLPGQLRPCKVPLEYLPQTI